MKRSSILSQTTCFGYVYSTKGIKPIIFCIYRREIIVQSIHQISDSIYKMVNFEALVYNLKNQFIILHYIILKKVVR